MTMIALAELAGRCLLAALFVFSGLRKAGARGPCQQQIAAAGLPLPGLAYFVALVIDFVGGAALIAGFWTVAAAGTLALFTGVLAFTFHKNFADGNQTNHFMKNVALVGGLLIVCANGPGPISLDAWVAR